MNNGTNTHKHLEFSQNAGDSSIALGNLVDLVDLASPNLLVVRIVTKLAVVDRVLQRHEQK